MSNTSNIKLLTKDHLVRIGQRMKSIRNELGLSSQAFTKRLQLPGAVMTRFENGDGIQIFNLLQIISWLNTEGYNIKWFLLFDNDNEFKKNENSLALYTDILPNDTMKRKEINEKTESIINLANEIINLSNDD